MTQTANPHARPHVYNGIADCSKLLGLLQEAHTHDGSAANPVTGTAWNAEARRLAARVAAAIEAAIGAEGEA